MSFTLEALDIPKLACIGEAGPILLLSLKLLTFSVT